MNQAAPPPTLDRDEINLIDLAHKLLVRWPIIFVFMALGLLAGILNLRYAVYTYTAEMKVMAVQNTSQGSLTGSLGQLGGLAALVGVNLPRNDGTPFFLYVESIHSRAVADELAKNVDLLKGIYKGEYDPTANRFIERPTRVTSWTTWVKQQLGIPIFSWTPPGGARLQIDMEDAVEVIEDIRKPVVILRYNHPDPVFAAAFLTELNRTIDSQLRQKTLSRVNENITYLSQQLSTVRLAEHRQAIITMLSEQEKVKMMASSNAPVAAEIVSGPTSSFLPTRPRQLVVIAVTLLAGLLLGCIAALAWEWFANRRRVRPAVVALPANFIQPRLEPTRD